MEDKLNRLYLKISEMNDDPKKMQVEEKRVNPQK